MADQLTVRPLEAADSAQWRKLYQGFREFYHLDPNETVLDTVWGWLQDPTVDFTGLVAEKNGAPIAIAHYRFFFRPDNANIGLFMDEIFTDPAARGSGAARMLMARLREIAHEKGANVVRWYTEEFNTESIAFYERFTKRSNLVTFDLSPAENGALETITYPNNA